MARLPLIDPDNTTGDIRASFDRMPVKLNIFRMMAHAEANMIPAMRFANSILHKQKLSAVNRELLILQVAQLEGGAYEWRQHVPIALGVGVTQAPDRRAGSAAVSMTTPSTRRSARCWRSASTSVENVRVPEPVFAEARKHFSEQEIVEAHLCHRLLHDDGPPDRGDRDRSRSRRRHAPVRQRQEAERLRWRTALAAGALRPPADSGIRRQCAGQGPAAGPPRAGGRRRPAHF